MGRRLGAVAAADVELELLANAEEEGRGFLSNKTNPANSRCCWLLLIKRSLFPAGKCKLLANMLSARDLYVYL